MTRFIRKLVASAAVVSALALGASAAQAGDDHCYVWKKVICYKTVCEYVTKCEPYTVCVTKYDHCGYPYTVHETRYKEYKVPVKKEVAYTKWVKVPAYDY